MTIIAPCTSHFARAPSRTHMFEPPDPERARETVELCINLKRAHYTAIVNEGLSQKCIDGKDVRIVLNYVGVSRHLDRHQVEFWMTALVRVCRQLTGLRLLPAHVRFAHSRERRPPEFAEFFGHDIEFGAAVDEVAFAKRVRKTRAHSKANRFL